jgi:hypothetical protein
MLYVLGNEKDGIATVNSVGICYIFLTDGDCKMIFGENIDLYNTFIRNL